MPHKDLSLNTSDSSSDEDAPVPRSGTRMEVAYRNAKLRLKAIQFEQKILEGHALCAREELRLLKKLLYNAQKSKEIEPIENASTSHQQRTIIKNKVVPLSTQKLSHTKQYNLQDHKNNCYISITIDVNRQNIYYLTIKGILHNMKIAMEIYSNIIPIKLFQYVVRVILEKQITELLVGYEEKLKYKGLKELYREKYPISEDDDFLEKTLCEIWRGEYNDPVEADGTGSQQDKVYNKNVSLDDISYTEGIWQTVVYKETTELDTEDIGAEDLPGPPEAKIRKICSKVASS